MRKLLLALAFLCLGGPAWAQNPTCPTRPAGDNSNACASTAFVQNAISGGGGGVLTQYYVATTGNDSNTCLASTVPCLTLQGAWNKIAVANHGLGGSQLNIADGTYTGALNINGTWTGAGPLSIVGNVATPDNVFINVTGANAIKVSNSAVDISGVKIQTTNSFGALVSNVGATVRFFAINFTGVTGQHITASYGGKVYAVGNYSISGGGESHWHVDGGGLIEIDNNAIITLSGTPTFTAYFAGAGTGEIFLTSGVSFAGTGAHGAKWLSHSLSRINTSGLGVNAFPGDIPGGTVDSCGMYDLLFNCPVGMSAGAFLTPDALFTANDNTVATVAPLTHSQFHAVGADSAGAGYACDVFGTGTGVCVDISRVAYGTAAAKTSVTGLAIVKTIGAQAYDSTGAYGSVAALDFLAANSQTGTDHGGYINMRAVAPGSTVLANVARFESSGFSLFGTTSGSVKLTAPAIAGSNVITFPAGTTDFSATGGTSRVVKQTSAGGALTVAQLACSDLSGVGAGCSAAAGITALTGDVTASGSGSVAATLATAQPAVHTWALAQTFTVAPVFTDASGTRTALGLGALTTVTPGTGIATALAVNVGTAGAPVINGGALGSPSSAGTIPAHTLGGTVSGGGNQINNVIIGTTTPLAGFFTTLSATTSITSPLHYGGSSAGSTLTLNGTSNGSPSSAYLLLQSGTTQFVGINNATPKATLDINNNTSSSPALIVATDLIRLQSADTVNNGMEWVAYGSGGGNFLNGAVAGGTSASPTATPANINMFNLGGFGWNGSAWAKSGIIAISSNSLWTGSNQATKIDFYTTPTGSTTVTLAMTIQPTGGLSIGTATDPGTGMIYTNAAAFMTRTKTSWTNGAGAGAGTITTAPSAGNPTKWIPVDDNGTTRYIPAW